jgi:hypothetical protein
MSLELTTLRAAAREVDYRQRVCEDAVRFATSDKTGALPKYQRNLKKAQTQFQAALEVCRTSGVEFGAQDLPKPVAEPAGSAAAPQLALA